MGGTVGRGRTPPCSVCYCPEDFGLRKVPPFRLPSADTHGLRFPHHAARALSGACILRPLPCREAVTTGAMSEGRTSVFCRRKGGYEAGKDCLPYHIRRRRRSTPQPLKGEAFPLLPAKAPLLGELAAKRPEGFVNGCAVPSGPPSHSAEKAFLPKMSSLPQGPCGGVKTPPYEPAEREFCIFHVPAGRRQA